MNQKTMFGLLTLAFVFLLGAYAGQHNAVSSIEQTGTVQPIETYKWWVTGFFALLYGYWYVNDTKVFK